MFGGLVPFTQEFVSEAATDRFSNRLGYQLGTGCQQWEQEGYYQDNRAKVHESP